MVNSVGYYNYQNNNNSTSSSLLGCAAVAAGWEAETFLRQGLRVPCGLYVRKNFKNVQGGGYKPYVEKAIKQNNLERTFKVLDLNPQSAEAIKKELGFKFKKQSPVSNIIGHILRFPNKKQSSFMRTLKGENAFFYGKKNAVVCNFDKFGAPVFHEIQHKLNSQSSNLLIRTLAKIRGPLAAFGTLGVSMTAMLTDKKNKNDPRRGFNDFVKDNCGILATACMLPLTIEECIANYKGTGIAKRAGVSGDMLKKVVKIHKLSSISYCAAAAAIGLAAWAGNKIRDGIKKEA